MSSLSYKEVMNKKSVAVIGAGILGVSGAAAVHRWPEHSIPIQMTLYSLTLLLILLPAFWADRHHPKYVAAMSSAFFAHLVILLFIRSLFPFKTILEIVPVLIVEAMILTLTIIKVRGEREVGASNDAAKSHEAASSHQKMKRRHYRR